MVELEELILRKESTKEAEMTPQLKSIKHFRQQISLASESLL